MGFAPSRCAIGAKTGKKDQKVCTGDRSIAIDILFAANGATEFTQQAEEVFNGCEAISVQVARTRSQLTAGYKTITVDVLSQGCNGCSRVNIGIVVVAIARLGHPPWRGNATMALCRFVLISKPVPVCIWPSQGRIYAAAIVFGGTKGEIASVRMGATGELIAVTNAVIIGVSAQAIAQAIQTLQRENARAVIADHEDVKVAGRGVRATRCIQAVAIVHCGLVVVVASHRVGAAKARKVAISRAIGRGVEVAGVGQHAAR
jgi:hypothetical protein